MTDDLLSLDITLAPIEERQILRNLMELYQYETSVHQDEDVGPMGLYLYRYFDHYWTDEGRYPFLFRLNSKLVGFALINQHCLASDIANTHTVAEFFILGKYRRRGLGQYAASYFFDLFPGAWEVQQVAANHEAQCFWRTVIDAYTKGQYNEVILDDHRWNGPVQTFLSQ